MERVSSVLDSDPRRDPPSLVSRFVGLGLGFLNFFFLIKNYAHTPRRLCDITDRDSRFLIF